MVDKESLFEVSYWKDRREPDGCHVNVHPVPYAQKMFNAIDRVALKTIEEDRHQGFYITVGDEVLSTLERIVPLPLEKSDCGKGLGYPELNEEYRELRDQSFSERELLRGMLLEAIKENSSDLIELINDPKNRSTIDRHTLLPKEDALRSQGKCLVEKNVWSDTQVQPEVTYLILDAADRDRISTILQLTHAEKRLVGIKGEGTTAYYLYPGA